MRTAAIALVWISSAGTAAALGEAIYFAFIQEWRASSVGLILAIIMASQIFVGLGILTRHPRRHD